MWSSWAPRPGPKRITRSSTTSPTTATVIVDDTNPLELSGFLEENEVDIFVGGVKERPIAYKLGVGFCDHNHERKIALAGFVGMLNFAKEVYSSVMSPVWRFVPRRAPSSGRASHCDTNSLTYRPSGCIGTRLRPQREMNHESTIQTIRSNNQRV